MAANISVADLTTMRDNLVTAYTTISTSPTSSYTLGERMFTYEDRDKLWAEINRLTKIILLRTSSTDCRGFNRIDVRKWDVPSNNP